MIKNLLKRLTIRRSYGFTYKKVYEKTGNGVQSEIKITGYHGKERRARIPNQIGGLPVKVIGQSFFSNCPTLSELTIPEGITTVATSTFSDPTPLSSFQVLEGNPSLQSEDGVLFSGNGLILIKYPSGKPADHYRVPPGILAIETGAFAGCSSLKEIGLPESIVQIGEGAFAGCSSLTSIEIPPKVERIESETFRDCRSLLTITLPERLLEIGHHPFDGCSSLREFRLSDKNAHFKVEEGILYRRDGAKLIQCPRGKSLGVLQLPDGLTEIGPYAFESCNSLTEIIIPESVTTIRESAFSNCSSLRKVKLPKQVDLWEYAFQNCVSLTDIKLPEEEIPNAPLVFNGCPHLSISPHHSKRL